MKLPQSSRVHCNRIKTPPRRANHCEEIGAWASMSPMKIWRRPILFGVIVTLGVLGALKLHNANAQTTGAVAASQKPLYAARLEAHVAIRSRNWRRPFRLATARV